MKVSIRWTKYQIPVLWISPMGWGTWIRVAVGIEHIKAIVDEAAAQTAKAEERWQKIQRLRGATAK